MVGAKERKTDGRRSEIDEEDMLYGESGVVLVRKMQSEFKLNPLSNTVDDGCREEHAEVVLGVERIVCTGRLGEQP